MAMYFISERKSKTFTVSEVNNREGATTCEVAPSKMSPSFYPVPYANRNFALS